MVPLHAAITEIKIALGASNVSLATSPDPGYQNRLAIAHEHLEQTEGLVPQLEAQEQTGPSVIFNNVKRLHALADGFLKTGKVEKAIKLLKKAVSIQEQLPQEDKGRLASKHELGRAYSMSGRFVEAIKILEDVTNIRGEILDPSHHDYLESQHELAFAHMQNGQPTEAVKILKQVVTTEDAILNKKDMDHLTSQHELARAYLADGQAAEAITLIEHVVAVKTSILGESHPKLLASQIVLAEAELMTGRVSDAVKLLEHVVAITEASSSQHDELRPKAWAWLRFARQKALGGGLVMENSDSHSVRAAISL